MSKVKTLHNDQPLNGVQTVKPDDVTSKLRAAKILGCSRTLVLVDLRSGRLGGLTYADLLDYAERTGRAAAVASLRTLLGQPVAAPAEAPAEKPRKARKTAADWARIKTKEDALKARLSRQELQGALVRRSLVDIAWATHAAQVRDQIMQLGPRLGGRLAAETDPQACAQIVTDEVLVALRAVAQGGQGT